MRQENQPGPNRIFKFISEWGSDLLPSTRAQVLTATRTAIVVVIALIGIVLFLCVLSWLSSKAVWDLLKVLALPMTVGAAVPLLNWLQKRRELEIENQSTQDATLQAYLGGMSQLILDERTPLHKAPEGGKVYYVARAQTLTALARLDTSRKRRLLQFLRESSLIGGGHNVILLSGADLQNVDLSYWHLPEAGLNDAHLEYARLSRTTLQGASLFDAYLNEGDLTGANLTDAQGITQKQLAEVKALRGATIPDGQILKSANQRDGPTFEDWLKSKGREKEGETGGPS